MIVYSVTVTVEQEIEHEWSQWMREHHIPAVMATGCFISAQFHRLLDPPSEKGHATFNTQYTVEGLHQYKRYQDNFAAGLQKDHNDRYQGRFVAFRTLLRRDGEFRNVQESEVALNN
jgi:hypothetical protein